MCPTFMGNSSTRAGRVCHLWACHERDQVVKITKAYSSKLDRRTLLPPHETPTRPIASATGAWRLCRRSMYKGWPYRIDADIAIVQGFRRKAGAKKN